MFAGSWIHDGSAAGARKLDYGNNWAIVAIVVRLAFLDRPLALPVAFALVRNGPGEFGLAAAHRLVESLAAALPGRRLHVVAETAYGGKVLRNLPGGVSSTTTRLRTNAALHDLAPPRTGTRGQPKTKGSKLQLAEFAKREKFTAVGVCRCGQDATVRVAVIRRLWYGPSAAKASGSCWSGTGPNRATTCARFHRPFRYPGGARRRVCRQLVRRYVAYRCLRSQRCWPGTGQRRSKGRRIPTSALTPCRLMRQDHVTT